MAIYWPTPGCKGRTFKLCVLKKWDFNFCIRSSPLISHLSYPSTARVVGALHTISKPVASIFPCSPLPSGTWRTPGLSITWCCLPTSSSVCLVFFPLSLCLARWFWPDLMDGRHDHTTAACVSLREQEVFVWCNCLLDLGTDFLVGNMVFVWDA